jgi:RNA polymerase sigma factor (sigma-70 family)
MSFRSLARVLQNIRRAAIVSGAVPRTDGQLLDAFVNNRDEACFDALMRRYGPVVFSVCRRVLHNTHDAEDAFQTTFLVLVRKAARLRRRGAVGNWLYGVAHRTALQAKSRSARRRLKEWELPQVTVEESAAERAGKSEMLAALDREVLRLPEKYRAPIILCELMGRSKKQAAEELGCPEGTISSRLARGREILRRRLGHYDPDLGGGGETLMLGATTTQILPLGLYSKTLKAAALVAKGKLTAAGGLPPNVAVLLREVLRAMLITKLVTGVVVLVVVGSVVGGGAKLVVEHHGVGQAPTVVVRDATNKVALQPQAPKTEKPVSQEPPKEALRYGGKDFKAWRDELLTDLKPQVQIQAMQALGAFGNNGYAEEATTAIVQAMKKPQADREVLTTADNTLVSIGTKTLPALTKLLESENFIYRRRAAEALVWMLRAFPKETLPVLLPAFADEDRDVRNTALVAFVPTGRPLPPMTASEKQVVVTALIKQLKDDDIQVHTQAANALALFGPDAKAAVPTLIKFLRDASPALKDTIRTAPASKKAAPAVQGGKAKGDFGGGVGGADPDTLFDMLAKGNDAIIISAAEMLRPSLEQYAAENGNTSGVIDRGQFNAFYQSMLAQMAGKGGFGGITGLGNDFGQPQSGFQGKKAGKGGKGFGVGGMGGQPGGFGGRQPDNLRLAILKALGSIGPGAKEAVPLLLDLLRNDYDGTVRGQAIQTLGMIGPDAKDAVPVLLEGWNKSWWYEVRDFQSESVITFGKIGPAAQAAVPLLVSKLRPHLDSTKGYPVSEWINQLITALGDIGPAAKEALPTLRELEAAAPTRRDWSAEERARIQADAAAAIKKISQ